MIVIDLLAGERDWSNQVLRAEGSSLAMQHCMQHAPSHGAVAVWGESWTLHHITARVMRVSHLPRGHPSGNPGWRM